MQHGDWLVLDMHHLRRQMSAQVEDCSLSQHSRHRFRRLSKKGKRVGWDERPKEETLEDIS